MPQTSMLWTEQIGRLLDEHRPPEGPDGWYGDWCFVGALDAWCVNVARDLREVAAGGAPVLRFACVNNGLTGGGSVHGCPHWVGVVYSVRRRSA